MRTALVGSTGFVGGNLRNSRHFDELFSSANSAEMSGHYDRVVFAAAKAEKWRINQDPDADLLHIAELERILSRFTTDQLVLVSTVDVYKSPVAVNEDTLIDTEDLHPYGLHRFRLEEFAKAQHATTTVLRLPGLFGTGLKKNVIYDLLHNHNVDRIHHAGSFQYYNLERLAGDIDTAVEADLPLVNLTSEPIRTDEIARECFGVEFSNVPEGVTAGSYDMRTRYAQHFGGDGEYTYDKKTVLKELRIFVDKSRMEPAR